MHQPPAETLYWKGFQQAGKIPGKIFFKFLSKHLVASEK